jgi:hypothetical protein
MSSLVFRDREGDFAGLGGVPVLCSTLPGVVIGGLRIDECLLWEGDPASCMYAMPTESGVNSSFNNRAKSVSYLVL